MKDVAKAVGLGSSGDGGAAAAAQATQAAQIAAGEKKAQSEQARLLAEQMARQRAAARGGFRALLSSARLNPESGLQTTLGA